MYGKQELDETLIIMKSEWTQQRHVLKPRRQTIDDRRQTIDDRQQTIDDRRQTIDDRRQTIVKFIKKETCLPDKFVTQSLETGWRKNKNNHINARKKCATKRIPYKKGMSYELLETRRSPQKYEYDAVDGKHMQTTYVGRGIQAITRPQF